MPHGAPFFDAQLLFSEAISKALRPAGGIMRGCPPAHALDATLFPRARPLNLLVPPNDPRFPRGVDVLDLEFDAETWNQQLRLPPSAWWPLISGSAASGSEHAPGIVHLNVRGFPFAARGVTQLARHFSQTQFIVDPFVEVREDQWRAGVCLAEEPNIWVTTFGLFGPRSPWNAGFHKQALYFSVGEIGAGKVLFASGLSLEDWAPNGIGEVSDPYAWLRSCEFLEDEQIALILRKNAAQVLAFRGPS